MKNISFVHETIRRDLLGWYSREKRDLPWRHTRDPYKIWVSEIMLQQTQVATVIPYYEKWIEVFPSLNALARAPLSKVLRFWAGLGYYRRARMLHQAAQHVQKKLLGNIPQTAEALSKLSGIGRYTAGAIASIAFEKKTPVLDGNVIRILSRIFAVPQSVDRPETLEKLWAIAGSLLPDKKPGDFNQALMELGATVCFPLTPRCAQCPVRRVCLARQKGEELRYPVRSRKESYEKLRTAALVVRNDRNEVLLEKQPKHGRWGGLWMFPFWTEKKKMFSSIKPLFLHPKLFLKIQHSFTKYRITLEAYEVRHNKRLLGRPCGKWHSLDRLAGVAFPSPHRKIALALKNPRISFPQKRSSRETKDSPNGNAASTHLEAFAADPV